MTPAQLDLLALRWADYQRALRHAWVRSPHIERRFFRSQNVAEYTADRRLLTIHANRAVARWHAQVRKICGRMASIDTVGVKAVSGMPPCFLVRVPKPGVLESEEVLFGTPHRDDAAGLERVAHMLDARRKAKREAATRARIAYLDAKLVESVRKLREAQVEHAQLLDRARTLGRLHPERLAISRGLATGRERVRRALLSSHTWRRKLSVLGIERSLEHIDTSAEA